MDNIRVERDSMTSFVLLVKNNYFWENRRTKTFKAMNCIAQILKNNR